MSHPWLPNWRGRSRFWENLNWSRTPELDLAVGLYRWQTEHGWEARYYLLFRRIGEDQVYQVPVLSQTFITTPTGSLQTSTSDATWNNANNKVECVGPGGSGAITLAEGTGGTAVATGGGGGAYSAITNFSFATPGTTTYQWQVGTGGAAIVSLLGTGTPQALTGNNGASATWFNAASDPGNGADNSKCSAAAGKGGTVSAINSSGAGGLTAASWGTTKNAGGGGGQVTASATRGGTGGGGAAGPNGVGGNGVNVSTNTSSNGGQGDSTSGGTGGTGSTAGVVGNGNPGTELGDSVHGCGGGGGGQNDSTNAATVAGSGGLYGAGGGGNNNNGSGGGGSTKATSGAGTAGIIVLTWTPAVSFTWLPMFQDAIMPWQMHEPEIIGY